MAKNMQISLLLDFYGDMLTEKQREVIEYYYNDDLSLSEIAANEGITRQGVRDSIKRAEFQMFEMEERLQVVARFREMRLGLQKILSDAQRIKDYNDQYTYSGEITALVDDVINTAGRLCE